MIGSDRTGAHAVWHRTRRLRRLRVSLARLGVAACVGASLATIGIVPTTGLAQANRTWVASTGLDTAACSRTAPCATFAGAIAKTGTDGEINVVDNGNYGPVTITKGITIDGQGSAAFITTTAGNAITVNAGNTSLVVLRNLSIDGISQGAAGIVFTSGAGLFVENVTIKSVTATGIDISPTNPTDVSVQMSNVLVRGVGGTGILLAPQVNPLTATINHVTLDRNWEGLSVQGRARAALRDGQISNNATVGVHVQPTGNTAELTIDDSAVAANGIGVSSGGGGGIATVRLAGVTVSGNTIGLQTGSNGAILSFGDNVVGGNGTDGAPTGTVPLQ